MPDAWLRVVARCGRVSSRGLLPLFIESKDMNDIMTGLTSHHFEGRSIRTSTNDEGEPLFIARDVCDVLDLVWSDTQKRLSEKAKGGGVVAHSLGGKQEFATLTEGGLYECIFQSRKPEAQFFREWVCYEVLPMIRKQGIYLPGATAAERAEALRQLLIAERAIARGEARKAKVLAGEALPARRDIGRKCQIMERPEGWMTIPEFVRTQLPATSPHHGSAAKSLGWKCRDAIEGETCVWVQGMSTAARRAYLPGFLEERWPLVARALGDSVGGKEVAA